MKLKEAIDIVLELAQSNVLDPSECDHELLQESERQQKAVNIVSDYIYNYLEDKLDAEDDDGPES